MMKKRKRSVETLHIAAAKLWDASIYNEYDSEEGLLKTFQINLGNVSEPCCKMKPTE